METEKPVRFIGIDLHKHYLVAIGVDANLEQVFGPQRVGLVDLGSWITRTLTSQDAVVLEMTTNTWQVHDELLPHVHSVCVVHPPHLALITRSQVMTDKIAALSLARLLAKGLLVSIWIPPEEVRQLRTLLAQRLKMVKLSTQARNRLHAVLHRHHLALPIQGNPFLPEMRTWWVALPLSSAEKVCVLSDLDSLSFARTQITFLEQALNELIAQDERAPLLLQITGISRISALAILAAIGTIERFPDPKCLVGYAGLGSRIHASGQTTRTGRITKAGRKDLRAALVETAWTAVRHDPHWIAQFERLAPRLGPNKAIVAIARKLLVHIWHILTNQQTDRFADPARIARKLMQHAYHIGKANRLPGQSTAAYVRQQLEHLAIDQNLQSVDWGIKKKPIPLPPSSLPPVPMRG